MWLFECLCPARFARWRASPICVPRKAGGPSAPLWHQERHRPAAHVRRAARARRPNSKAAWGQPPRRPAGNTAGRASESARQPQSLASHKQRPGPHAGEPCWRGCAPAACFWVCGLAAVLPASPVRADSAPCERGNWSSAGAVAASGHRRRAVHERWAHGRGCAQEGDEQGAGSRRGGHAAHCAAVPVFLPGAVHRDQQGRQQPFCANQADQQHKQRY